jgi:hypothetical protein
LESAKAVFVQRNIFTLYGKVGTSVCLTLTEDAHFKARRSHSGSFVVLTGQGDAVKILCFCWSR